MQYGGSIAAIKRRTAIGSWAAMVGAMILARVTDDPALSGEVLDQTHAWLETQRRDRGQNKTRNRSTKVGRPAC